MNKFSFFKYPISNTTPNKHVTLVNVWGAILGDKYKEITTKIRKAESKVLVNDLKTGNLDFVTFSGEFFKRSKSGLKTHSGLICLDIDNIQNIDEAKERIVEGLPPILLFASPSGNGLKVIYRIDIKQAQHLDYFYALERYFKQHFNIVIDKSCKDVSRPCFLCHDEDVYYNEDSKILDKAFVNSTINYSKQIELLAKSIDKKEKFVEGNRNNYISQLAGVYNRFGIPKEIALNELKTYSEQGFTESEIISITESVYSNTDWFNIASFDEHNHTSEPNKYKEEINGGLFLAKPASEFMEDAKNIPTPKMLFSEFWFEGELCILYSDTNKGKSLIAVQIADSISKGEAITGFKLEIDRQKVLLFDFELSFKQFEHRYSADGQQYYFDDNFYRVEINPDVDLPKGINYEEFLIKSFEEIIIKEGVKILIIDNLTFLKNDQEKAKDALELMKQLKKLKSKYGLSILVLGHTPKRDNSKPISINDLAGSKMLVNFCDSAFAIGQSETDHTIKYLKQVKQRNVEQIYNETNVCLCTIEKTGCFLGFTFMGFGDEFEHLKRKKAMDKEAQDELIYELYDQGFSYRDIARKVGNISHTTVKRKIDQRPNKNLNTDELPF